jgi:predicted Zn-dependent protease
MPAMHFTLRRVTLAAGLVVGLWGATAAAQTKRDNDNGAIPFLNGFGAKPDELFERMFGQSTAEEERTLEKVTISIKEEREFGQPQVEAFLAQLKEQGLRVVRKGKDVDYLRQLVETVHPFIQNPKRYGKITIYVVDSPRVDARTFPGGTIFFFKGLLSFAENEAALAGIVGHELSHLDRGHLLLPLRRARLIERSRDQGGAGFDPQKFFAQETSMMRLMSRPFRPEDEAAADRDGAAWAYRAGYDPREMAALFSRLHARDNDPKVPFASFFRTHPYSDDRSAAILAQYDEMQKADPRDGLYRGEKNLAQRIPRSQQEFPEQPLP